MSVMRRLVATLCAVTGLLVVASVVPAMPVAGAQTTSRAVVIVSTGSGVQTRVIEFSGTVSGLEALQLAGASPETITYGPLGQAVCKLYGVGDEPVPGQCPGGWVYYRAVGGAGGWNQSSLGASGTTVHDGDVEGWGYGGAPPFSSFCAVVGCAPPPTEAPPAIAPPSGGSSGGTGGGAGVAVAGETATTAPGGTASAPGGDTPATTAPSATGTTLAGKEATTSGPRSGRTLAAGVAATSSSGSDGGSPVGVIVAVVVVALLVGGGVVLRKRRSTG
ncbi:MAG: hypothetical protein U0W40_18250 [Acidimicrobiia bacterium]